MIDATFATRRWREAFLDAARRRGAPSAVVHLECPEPVVRRRLALRAGRADEVSDADLEVYRRGKTRFEPPVARELAGRLVPAQSPLEPPEVLVGRVIDTLLGAVVDSARPPGSLW